MTPETEDIGFTARALDALPPVGASPGLSLAILAAYDTWQVGRHDGVWAALASAGRRFSEIIWPGAPAWAPSVALAAALLIGIGIGTALPYPGRDRGGFSLDEPPSFSLLGTDQAESL